MYQKLHLDVCDLWCYSLIDCSSQIIIGWHHPAIMHWSTTDVYRTGSQLVYPFCDCNALVNNVVDPEAILLGILPGVCSNRDNA